MSVAMTTEPLWRPSALRIEGSNLHRFMQCLKARRDLSIEHYADLHAWSLQRPDAFWFELAHFADIKADWADAPVLRHGEIALDTVAKTASLAGQPLDLTAREFQILSYLMLRQGRIVPQSDIADHVYALDAEAQPNTIEVLVARLRKKIGREAIRTVRGLGYRLG